MVVGFHSCGGLRRCMPSMTFDRGASTSLRLMLPRYKHYVHLEPTLLQKKFRVPGLLIRSRELVLSRSSPKSHTGKSLQQAMDEEWSALSLLSIQPSLNKSERKILAQEDPSSRPPSLANGTCYSDESGYCNSGDITLSLSDKEIERRRKIGAANRGKVPWNKGREFSEETRQLIKKRTVEALRDPKVRKKMLGLRQSHREVSKEKISTALRKIWERRIVSVRSRQKVLGIWGNSIVEAAKQGGHGQDKLDWDSYDRIKADMISECLRKEDDKARAKEAKKKLKAAERAERAKQRNSEGKKSKPKKLVLQRSNVEQKRVVISASSKLKERLTKLHRRKKELEVVISSRRRK